MTELDQELRELLETKARDGVVQPKPEPQVLKRARRRQGRTVLTAFVGTAALVVASLVGLQALVRTAPVTPIPADVPVLPDTPEGFQSVILPFASMVYPKGWSVLSFREGPDLFQLTNFDPELEKLCPTRDTRSLPPLGALLIVERYPGAADPSAPTWPVGLYQPDPRPSDCGGAQEETFGEPQHYRVTWREGSTEFVARAMIGPNAPDAVRRLVLDSFSSLDVIEGDQPQMEELLGTANLILDSTRTPVGPVVLYTYTDSFEGGSVWNGIAGSAGSHLSGASQVGRDSPQADENVTMNLDLWGGVVWGEVAASVARAEIRTVEGATFPAKLLPLPPLPFGLGVDGQQVVWGVVEGPTAGRVTTLLYDEQGNVLNTYFPGGPRVTIAEGTDPDAGAWVLYLDVTSEGTGLGFQFETGSGGSGCCLKPFDGDFRLDGWGSGGDEPANITALGSDLLDRVVFEAISGEVIDGQVFPIPDESLGVPKVALVLVPHGVPVEGDLVGYDAAGNEIGREFVGDVGEPPGPTPEIDAVWNLLRQALDAISQWASRPNHALADLTIEVANASMPEVPWNASGQGKPVPGQVSIRGVAAAGGSELTGWSGWTLALVSATGESDGSVTSTYCIAVNIDGGGGGNYRYGTQDAAGYEACRGGWPELQL
jgi:hypothetical protein